MEKRKVVDGSSNGKIVRYYPVTSESKWKYNTVQALNRIPRTYYVMIFFIVILVTLGSIALWYIIQQKYQEENCSVPGAVASVTISNVTNSSLTVMWEDPLSANLSVSGYSVTLRDGEGHLVKRVSVTENRRTFGGLHPWVPYHAEVSTFIVLDKCSTDPIYGLAVSANAMTDVGVPSIPTEPRVSSVSNESIVLTWEKPHVPNGPITGYIVRGPHAFPKHDMTTIVTNYTVRGLKPWTKYRFSVSAFNKLRGTALVGPEVNLEAQTTVSAPSAASRLRIETVTNSTLQVIWEKPETPNGPIDGYVIRMKDTKSQEETVTKETSFVSQNLKPWTWYTFEVCAFNELREHRLRGPVATVSGRTAGLPPPYLGARLSILGTEQESASIVIPLGMFSNKFGPVMEYVLLVAQSENEAMVEQQGYDGLNAARFLNWDQSKGTDHWYRASPEHWNYETDNRNCKYYNEESRLCRIGLDKTCSWNNKYCNGPLKSSTTYWAKIRAYTAFGWSETYPVSFTTEAEIIRKSNYDPDVSYSPRRSGAEAVSGFTVFFMLIIALCIT